MNLPLYNLSPERFARDAGSGAWLNVALPGMLAEQARARPKALAIQSGDRSISFEAFIEDAQRIADGLRALQVRPGDIVAFQLPTSYEAVVLHYAIASAGAVSSPIPMFHREYDLRVMLRIMRPRLVVVRNDNGGGQAGMMERLVGELQLRTRVVAVGDERGLSELRGQRRFAATGLDPNSALYIVWTSGTTGEPKGVVHTHNTGLSGLSLKVERMRVGTQDRMLIIAPIAHHIGICSMNLLGLAGIGLVLLRSWSATAAHQLIHSYRATVTSGPPTFLVDLANTKVAPQFDVSSLRLYVSGGAPLSPIVVERANQTLPRCRILASYGTSEEGDITSVGPEDPEELSLVSDGRPLRLTELRIMGPNLEDLPIGDEGELLVRSPGAFAGYAGRRDLTHQAFLPGGWRRTGDRGYLRDDGSVRITGRLRDIIIRGGINVPVRQIEDVLLTHPRIRGAAVVGMPDERLGERICAFLVMAGADRLQLADIQTFLERNGIARVYWPENLLTVESLPVTSSGKVQKYLLRQRLVGVNDRGFENSDILQDNRGGVDRIGGAQCNVDSK